MISDPAVIHRELTTGKAAEPVSNSAVSLEDWQQSKKQEHQGFHIHLMILNNPVVLLLKYNDPQLISNNVTRGDRYFL